MPPKAKITREMIIEAAFQLVREEGMEKINIRAVSKRLGCSTQPVMYHFARAEDLREAVYRRADAFHTEYIMNIQSENPMTDIGLNFVRFAATEKNLFRLIFQSNEFTGMNIAQLVNSEDIQPIIGVLSQATEVSIEQAREIFSTLALCVYGYSSLLANNSMEYDEESASKTLGRLLNGAVCASLEENEND